MTNTDTRGFTHESSRNESVEWWTPKYVIDAIGETYDLDPCAPQGGVPWIPAARHIALPDDGLLLPWDGFVWMNPPYGSQTAKWLDKLALHGNGIALVFARTDTKWFSRVVDTADCICFVRSRIRFLRNGQNGGPGPGAGSMLIGYGARACAAVGRSGLGPVWHLKLPAALTKTGGNDA